MHRLAFALFAAIALLAASHVGAAAQEAAAGSGAMSATADIPGDIHAGGHFDKLLVLPASGDVVVTLTQNGGTCLSGRTDDLSGITSSSGGVLYAQVIEHFHSELHGPSEEIGLCKHQLTFAPKRAGNATLRVSNYSAQSISVSMTITGASEPTSSTMTEATNASGETLPGAPATGRAIAR